MRFIERPDKPGIPPDEAPDRFAAQRRMELAEDARPGTFRYNDTFSNGEVRTTVERQGGLRPTARAWFFRRGDSGPPQDRGKVEYSPSGDEVIVHGDSLVVRNDPRIVDSDKRAAQRHGTETALLSEVSEQAQKSGARSMRVWVPDNGGQAAETDWPNHGFQETERDPGAKGVWWTRPL